MFFPKGHVMAKINPKFTEKNPFYLISWSSDFLAELDALSTELCVSYEQFKNRNKASSLGLMGTAKKNSVKLSEKAFENSSGKSSIKSSGKANSKQETVNKQDIVLVFPHGRPRRYLEGRYKKMAMELGRAHILPHILTSQDFVQHCLAHWEQDKKLPRELDSLDRMGLLYRALQEVALMLPEGSGLRQLVEEKDFSNLEPKEGEAQHSKLAQFFPWAENLDTLLEECFSELVELVDIEHSEGEVSAFAAMLLEQLRFIRDTYIQLLEEHDADTPAYALHRAAKYVQQNKDYSADFIPSLFRDKIIIFAGFVRLSEAENVIFRYFWERGASIVFHSDPLIYSDYLNQSMEAHYSCVEHVKWIRKWNTSVQLYGKISEHKNNIHFFAGYDAHSQIKAMVQDIEKNKEQQELEFLEKEASNKTKIRAKKTSSKDYDFGDDGCAIIMPKAETLMPILHELIEKDINISIGYPITRTLFGQFMESLLSLQENKETNGQENRGGSREGINSSLLLDEYDDVREYSYKWQDIIQLLRHPYARMLQPAHELQEDGNASGLAFDNSPKISLNNSPNNSSDELLNAFSGEMSGEFFEELPHGLSGEHFNTFSSSDNFFEEKQDRDEDFTQVPSPTKSQKIWQYIRYDLEMALRNGTAFVSVPDLLDDVLGNIEHKRYEISPTMNTFVDNFFENCVFSWEKAHSFADMADILENLSNFLLEHAYQIWQFFPLDTEAFVRMVRNLIPRLRNTFLSQERLSQNTLFRVLRSLLQQERIPFEADPLTGMQILGLSESRLLRFKSLHIIECTENNLPGTKEQNPLLPDSLRVHLGLAESYYQENIIAHNFYRLLAGAENVYLYWQEGMKSSEVQSTKNIRSRFMEELLWEYEQKIGRILKKGEAPLRYADCHPQVPRPRKHKRIEVGTMVQKRLKKFFEKPMSATALNTYLQCPAKFFYNYIGYLKSLDEVTEGDNYGELGNWLHELLKEIYEPYVGKVFCHNEESLEEALELFKARLKSGEVQEFLSPESYFMLEKSGRMHLTDYWYETEKYIIPESLEQEYSATLSANFFASNPLNMDELKIHGRFDRIDRRCQAFKYGDFDEARRDLEYWIIDYKTGRKQKISEKFWKEEELFAKINQSNAQGNQGSKETLLDEIAHKVQDFQLPFYLYLYQQNNPDVRCNAAWIFLSEDKKEVDLGHMHKYGTSEEAWKELEVLQKEKIPAVLQFILNHMLSCQYFYAREGKGCEYCPHQHYC